MTSYNKKINQIYDRVRTLSQGGQENIFEYFRYIDEIVAVGDYRAFEDMMTKYYKFDISQSGTIYQIKQDTWAVAKVSSNSVQAENLEDLFNTKGVYRQGMDVYLISDNTSLGSIQEFDSVDHANRYYDLNVRYSQLAKMRHTGLDVITYHPNPTQSFVVNNELSNLSYDSNLIYNYGIAIDLLIHQFDNNAYVEDYWVDEYAI
jgi:hypothetical protein